MQCYNNGCTNQVEGRAKTCSDKCRKAVSRTSVTNCDEVSVTSRTVTKCDKTVDKMLPKHFEAPNEENCQLIDRFNSGDQPEPLTANEVERKEKDAVIIKDAANRLKLDQINIEHTLRQVCLDKNGQHIFEDGICQYCGWPEDRTEQLVPVGEGPATSPFKDDIGPTAEPLTARRGDTSVILKQIDRVDLNQAIRAYPNDTWINSPEHNELMRRLKAWSIEKLEGLGYSIPAWKRAA